MSKISKTAAEALESWKSSAKYLGDDPMLDPEEVFAEAHKVVELAEAEEISLEELVPDETTRNELLAHAAECVEDEGLDYDDSPDENEFEEFPDQDLYPDRMS